MLRGRRNRGSVPVKIPTHHPLLSCHTPHGQTHPALLVRRAKGVCRAFPCCGRVRANSSRVCRRVHAANGAVPPMLPPPIVFA
ncbi:MAG: cytochrome c3 family protein [Candidatus Kapaibacteriota bacterium]